MRKPGRPLQSRHRQGTSPSLTRPRHIAFAFTAPPCLYSTVDPKQNGAALDVQDRVTRAQASGPEPDRVLAPASCSVSRRPQLEVLRAGLDAKPTAQSPQHNTTYPTNLVICTQGACDSGNLPRPACCIFPVSLGTRAFPRCRGLVRIGTMPVRSFDASMLQVVRLQYGRGSHSRHEAQQFLPGR